MSSAAACVTTTKCLALMFQVDLRPHVFVLQFNGVLVRLCPLEHTVGLMEGL